MTKSILTIVAALLIGLSACTDKNTSNHLVEKRIIQKIEVAGMGMLENLNIESIEKINDSTFKGIHTFTNPIFKKDVRVTKIYYFTPELDSITGDDKVTTEMKSEGEWVAMKF